MSLKIEHAHLVLPYQVLQDAWLISREGKITAYGCGVSPQQTFSTVIDAKGQYLTPGFVDLHVHGGAGADFRDGEETAFVRAMQAHLAGGTTTMLATVSSTTLEGTLESLRIYEAMRQREAQLPPLPRLAGVHLEGPYFSQKERGAQDETIIRLPDAAEYERILEQAPCLRRWSIACELPGALELGERLHKQGIMASVGHSDATTAQVYEAFGRGFHSVTHLYSGCSVLHRNGPHREGGVVEAAFLIDEMDVEVIADGVHLPPDFLRLIYKIKGPEHIALITDSIRAGAADVPEGTVVYDDKEGRRPICIKGGVAVMPDGKNFAGSIATTSRLVRTMVQRAGVELTAAVRMAALTPARMLGMDAEIGSIAVGKRADLLLLDSGLQVQGVIRDGKQVIDNRLN